MSLRLDVVEHRPPMANNVASLAGKTSGVQRNRVLAQKPAVLPNLALCVTDVLDVAEVFLAFLAVAAEVPRGFF